MVSKFSQQGEILIDHSDSPGLTPEWAAANGVTGPIVAGGKKYESGTKMCSHCGSHVLMHPMRSRPREWCRPCDAFLCEPCGLERKLNPSAPHRSYRQVLGELFDALQRGVTTL